jgi:hypothetical protein
MYNCNKILNDAVSLQKEKDRAEGTAQVVEHILACTKPWVQSCPPPKKKDI